MEGYLCYYAWMLIICCTGEVIEAAIGLSVTQTFSKAGALQLVERTKTLRFAVFQAALMGNVLPLTLRQQIYNTQEEIAQTLAASTVTAALQQQEELLDQITELFQKNYP